MFDPVSSWMRWNDIALAMMINSAKMGEASWRGWCGEDGRV